MKKCQKFWNMKKITSAALCLLLYLLLLLLPEGTKYYCCETIKHYSPTDSYAVRTHSMRFWQKIWPKELWAAEI